ncbi:hypothetical protein AB0L56_28355 [Streptomyces sp. NPDC052079]|uniref:hypothetical protein n=1 Tax=Streptomyces sp. NPDC052079 TaxID=3155526 RepID=UPI003426D7C8
MGNELPLTMPPVLDASQSDALPTWSRQAHPRTSPMVMLESSEVATMEPSLLTTFVSVRK